jgi:hypothetical protein
MIALGVLPGKAMRALVRTNFQFTGERVSMSDKHFIELLSLPNWAEHPPRA